MKLFLSVLILSLTPAAIAQERGDWRASSNTAKSVTGDIAFSGERIYINFTGFIVADIRSLTPAEVAALFEGATGAGTLYRTSIPGNKKFLHKSTLCGAEDTQWIVAYPNARTLQLAFFSGSDMPLLTPEALANNTNLCGTYSYTR